MIYFFGTLENKIFAVESPTNLTIFEKEKLSWLFGDLPFIDVKTLNPIQGVFLGPRKTMITPWSTNAVEITQNMGLNGIKRIEQFEVETENVSFDYMLFQKYESLDQNIFTIDIQPESILYIEDIASYNIQEGLALNQEEIDYLNHLSIKLNRKLTDSEVFGFSQVNSEHCRHKIFNGTFVIDGVEKETSLFKMIKKTSELNPNNIISAYKDNVAFVDGVQAVQFAPVNPSLPSLFEEKVFDAVLSLKAETHNFPTTVEPFNGAATGSGGEIRDRMAGGIGSVPMAGTAVYMTSYPRVNNQRPWENTFKERPWLYQTPLDILIKASNGASDFGNKFGQPLITGSLLTFEHNEASEHISESRKLGFDKVIMLAGGIGYAKKEQALKKMPKKGDKVVVMGGENYRIGMGGAAVSSADTGEMSSGIELNAVQRSNPEMQKRVCNAIRSMVEKDENTIVSIHDHGAGGHLNCLSELVEHTGGKINLDALPVGDQTLSAKEIIGNESQERMGLVIAPEHLTELIEIANREKAPIYEVGEITDNHRFEISSANEKPLDLAINDMFGSSPKTILTDQTITRAYENLGYDNDLIYKYVQNVLQLEAVACKDWLTNKVDRCVGGKVAKQQCVGQLQLPLNNVGVMALDYQNLNGIATSIGHAPISGLIDSKAGSINAIGEALSNIVFAPLKDGLKNVSLSANWMWPCNNKGENARLYEAVEACSAFAIALGINIPTGKDSLSMKQKYPNEEVLSPGTVIISAIGTCDNIKQIVEPIIQPNGGSLFYIHLSQDEFKLGGSSFAQTLNKIGSETPTIKNADHFKKAFHTIQNLIKSNQIIAGHDIGSGGLITTLLEMCFANKKIGANVDLSALGNDLIKILFAENIGLVIQANDDFVVENALSNEQISFFKIGQPTSDEKLVINDLVFDVSEYRDIWYHTSYLFDKEQTKNNKAKERFDNYKNQPLSFIFPKDFNGNKPLNASKRPLAAVIREKGSNSEREMANALYLAGFDVRDVHMTDLIEGRETLEDVQFIGAVGGFSNSDVLGSAKGWAGSFKYNEKAKKALENFFRREDTLSVGICNGCQLFMELELINPEHEVHGKMQHNDSGKHESGFTSVVIQKNNSVMLSSLEGSKLGVWISHGEGKFSLPNTLDQYHQVATYAYENYPANPNGSDYNTAMLCDKTGRHLVMMPHIERSIFPWNWAHYPKELMTNDVSPWLEAFVNARKWLMD
jgi:phosphoribosylformylglycinamidine synthase